jgi:hypothetical protein
MTDEWQRLAGKFTSSAAETPAAAGSLAALSRICDFMAGSDHGRHLQHAPWERYDARLTLVRRDGSFPTKSLRVMSLADNKVEFRLHDSQTGIERYFHPDEPCDHALSRFQEVVGSIDWRRPVTRPTFWEKLSAGYKLLFDKRYR